MQKYRNRVILGVILALAIYVVLLLVLDSEGQISEGVLPALASFPWPLLILVALCQVVAGLFRFGEWQYFLGVIDARRKISLADSAIIFVTGFVMVVSPGKAAELLKSVFLKAKTGVPIARSAPVVIAERVVDGLAVIAILTGVLLFAGDRLQLGDYLGISQTIVFSSALLLGGGLIVVQIAPLAYFFLDVVGMLPLLRRAKPWLTNLYESSRLIFQLRHVFPTMLMGVGVYSSSAFGFFLILSGFGLEPSPALFFQAAFIMGVSAAIGALSFVPNGAGVTEITNAAMLMVIVAPQHPELTLGVAAAASLLEGFFHKWFRVVVGMFVMIVFRRRLFPENFEAMLLETETSRTRPVEYAMEAEKA